ncbi:LuxR C-terminal-related transcriptional regulator [Micromonospora arida]|uniref:Response regulator transcription factor n=1 Tax=Micromonospora zamorensis TaxID=709883 RepID=A0ABZ1PIS2_9ACTN|nr:MULTISPECIES: response regulator transcription factor [Micromonospora]NJC11430.1 DNA-binding NarL/FixJ family response regulator [Micromonospora profundi]
MAETRVLVQAADALVGAGLSSHLATHPDIVVVTAGDCDVIVVQAERFTAEVVTTLRLMAATADRPVVLVIPDIDESQLITAVECQVVAILPRASVDRDRLVRSVLAVAAGGGIMPPQLIGRLLAHFRQMQQEVLLPNGLTLSGLTSREIEVLRLMADGLDTAEIAEEMRYSVRTVKSVIYGVMDRHKLRNRSHAVAYAVRAGLI